LNAGQAFNGQHVGAHTQNRIRSKTKNGLLVAIIEVVVGLLIWRFLAPEQRYRFLLAL
jgi:hypothetical protein